MATELDQKKTDLVALKAALLALDTEGGVQTINAEGIAVTYRPPDAVRLERRIQQLEGEIAVAEGGQRSRGPIRAWF